MTDTTENAIVSATAETDSSTHTIPVGVERDVLNGETIDNDKDIIDGNGKSKDAASPRKIHGISWVLVVGSVLTANFLFATDNTIAANIQPAVVQSFSSLDKLAWLTVAFFASSWGTNLLCNLVVGAVCAPISLFLLQVPNPCPDQTIKKRALGIDYIGVILLCGLILSIVIVIPFGGNQYPWNSGHVIALFVVVFVVLWGLLTSKSLQSELPRNSLRSHLYVPGVQILPFVAFQTDIAIPSGWLVGKNGYYVPCYIFACSMCLSGAVLLYTINQNTGMSNIYGYEVLLGLGSGASTQLTFGVASKNVVSPTLDGSLLHN
ncbi:hypothetical protein PISL3812_03697 [Talaromyces islandicus]|uniref:Uncharacterized protein n=1 Tax=Talaromyces islandicus TaxID=28573 RepID=A0A0U1LTF1_TALIS|nr:hypothetical protein PISL3812_03697 [Talaromyces islandicus]